MPKLKNRLLATLLALTTLITTINLPPLTTTTYAGVRPAPGSPNVVVGDQDPIIMQEEYSGTQMINNYVPSVQLMKISLIRVSDSSDAQRGTPVDKNTPGFGGIVQNPIFFYPESGLGGINIEDIYAPCNKDKTRENRGLSPFNSRRELLKTGSDGGTSYALSYGATWQYYNESKPELGGQYIATTDGSSIFSSQKIVNFAYDDPGVPGLVSGGLKAQYQTNPPTGLNIDSSLSNAEWFVKYVQASFQDPDPDRGATENKQVFIYHVIQNMMQLPNSETYSTQVDDVVKLLADGKAKILVEPCIVFKVQGCPPLETMFGVGDGNRYIALDAGTLGCCDDVFSQVHYGWTSSNSIKSSDRTCFNRITHGSAASAVENLYKSVMLDSTDESVGLYSYKSSGHWQNIYNSTGGDHIQNPNLGQLQSGEPGALVKGVYYTQVANNAGGVSNCGTVFTDTYGLANVGGLMLININYSSINYTVTAKGYGEPTYKTTPSGQKLPVYKEAFDAVTNKIIVNVQTRLKMDSEITDPASPVKGTKWVDEVLVAEPTNYNTELPRSDGSGAYKVQSITSDMTKVYIPGVTKSNLTLYYADENGNPLESYTQINGTPGNRNSSIITKDESTGQYYKLFLDNVNYYAFNPQTNEPDTYQLSVSNCVDTNKMGDANIATASNVFSDSKSGETNWLDITIPSIEKRPTNAAYILVKSTVNMGATLKHTTTDSLSEQVAQSRPQQHLDSAGNLVNEYALAYPEDNPSPENAKAVGEVETIQQQADNQIQFLIPIQKEYDISADSIQIIPNTSTSLLNLQINTESSATDSTAEDYSGKTTGETLYLFATTNLTKAQQIDNYFNDKRYDSNTESTHIEKFDPTNSGAYSSEFLKSFATKKLISPMVTSTTEDEVLSIFNKLI